MNIWGLKVHRTWSSWPIPMRMLILETERYSLAAISASGSLRIRSISAYTMLEKSLRRLFLCQMTRLDVLDSILRRSEMSRANSDLGRDKSWTRKLLIHGASLSSLGLNLYLDAWLFCLQSCKHWFGVWKLNVKFMVLKRGLVLLDPSLRTKSINLKADRRLKSSCRLPIISS